MGAHHGEFAQRLRHAGFSGPIISYEPSGPDFVILAQKAARDRLWYPINKAVGNYDGETPFYIMSSTSLNSVHRATAEGAEWYGMTGHEEVRVPIVRLDTELARLIARRPYLRMFLKMDTQGHDLAVFEGAFGILDHVPAALSEMSVLPLYEEIPNHHEAEAFYKRHSFHVAGRFHVARAGDGTLRQAEYDAVLVRTARQGR